MFRRFQIPTKPARKVISLWGLIPAAACCLILAHAPAERLISRITAEPAAVLPLGTNQFLHRQIYPAGDQASQNLSQALVRAAKEKKRILLDFGANWCGDCVVLDKYMHDPANLRLLETNFILVHINVGRYDENLGLAARYNIPLKKGIPAVAVLSSRGKLLYSQRDGEFESMSRINLQAVTRFLTTWKP